jgi:hypothetical protein
MGPHSPLARRLVTFALGVGAGLAAYATASSGLLGAVSLDPPAASASLLPPFGSCEQLRTWYVDQALPKVGPWGLSGPPVMYAMERGSAAAAPAQGAVGSSDTGTNVQEAGVDESDIAKTNGRIVVRVSNGRLVVTDVSGSVPRQLSTLQLPGPALQQPELLLHDSSVVVIGQQAGPRFGGPIPYRSGVASDPKEPLPPGILPGPMLTTRVAVIGVDLADPAAPQVTSDRSIDGGSVSAREYPDGTVRVVVTTGNPALPFVHPDRTHGPAEAIRANRRIVEQAPVDAWLPGVQENGGPRHPLLGCSDVRHPVDPSGPGTISVLTFPADDPASAHATGVIASGDLVYSSADRLYVATTAGRSTTVHAFELHGDRTTYAASGTVGGTVKDRWSLSEYHGHLRVAVAVGDAWQSPSQGRWQPPRNAVVVLDQRGGRLVRVGSVTGLGPGEQIQSVRWLGDQAVVVTFRQTDPLYTLDLSSPEHPRLVGTLKIPGFSSYLHPVGDHRLVGLGHDATSSGTDLGSQASAFDLTDPAHVRRTDTVALGTQTDVPAGYDPRAFTYLPAQRVLLTPVSDWRTGGTRLVAIHVSPDGGLSRVGSWAADGWSAGVRALPLGGGRVALVGNGVRLVAVP